MVQATAPIRLEKKPAGQDLGVLWVGVGVWWGYGWEQSYVGGE